MDARSKREIDLVNASALAEEEKASKINLINARTAAQKDQLAKKEAAIEMQRARFDKAVAIAQIVQNVAVAITSHLKTPWLIPFDIAMGALQTAAVIAQPIPRYKSGKKDSYQGLAIVGDGGKREVIKRKDGSIELTPPHDTLTYLHKDDIVFPGMMDFMLNNAMPKMKTLPVSNNNEINAAIEAQTKVLKPILNKIANNKTLHLGASDRGMVAVWQWGSNQTRYVNENTNW